MSEPVEKCPHCGASMKAYWHVLTPILVRALIKFRQSVLEKGKNQVHLIKDMKGKSYELAPYEWKNWTKVRFHGLAAKYKVDGKWKRGYWLLTARGANFLNGQIQIPCNVKTFRNKVIDHSAFLTTVQDVIGSTPYVETEKNIEFDVMPLEQPVRYTDKGQGVLI